jgi:hypothetical protein
MAHGNAIPMSQIPTETLVGSWMSPATTGAAAASTPSRAEVISVRDQRATTKASTDTSNRRGSSCPERCAAITGTTTAMDSAASGTRGKYAHNPKATTGIAPSNESASDDGSATTATMATAMEKSGTKRRTSSPSDHA